MSRVAVTPRRVTVPRLGGRSSRWLMLPRFEVVALKQRLEARQVAGAEGGEAGVLDLVDQGGRTALDEPVVEGARAPALELGKDARAAAARASAAAAASLPGGPG